MLRVGLTGGIACGKSLVRERLAAAGLPTLDLDRMAHELMAPGAPAFAEVVAAFGREILGPQGAVDRRALGALVFADPAARARLDAIVHPRVRAEEALRAEALARQGISLLVTEAALLVESGFHLRFDRLVVVACRPEQQIARLLERDLLHDALARRRLAAQMPIDTKRRFGHVVVDTSGSLDESRVAADLLARGLGELALEPRPFPLVVPRGRALRALSFVTAPGPSETGPAIVARVLEEGGEPDLAALHARLRKGVAGQWWRSASAEGGDSLRPRSDLEAALWPAPLVTPLVLHELAGHGPDPERLAAAAHSLAWLVERDPSRLAAAVLFALVLGEVGSLGHVPLDLGPRVAHLRAPAERWGGGAPPSLFDRVIESAVAHPHDAAAAAAAAGPGAAALAGALVALGGG